MSNLYRLGKRIFSLNLSHWRERRLSGRLMRYYVKPAEDNRNHLARWIDFYGMLLVAVMLTFMVMYAAMEQPLRALLYSLPFWALEIAALLNIKAKKRNSYILHKKIWMAGRDALASIQGIKTRDDFSILVSQIFNKLFFCKDVHVAKRNDGENSGVSLRAVCNGVSVVISCDVPEGDKKETGPERVAEFVEEMKTAGLNGGVLVSSGDFSEEAKAVAADAGRIYIIRLVNSVKLVELARQAGHEIFSLEDVDQLKISDHAGYNNSRRMLKAAVGNRKRGFGYLSTSLILFAMYLTLNIPGSFNAFYLAFAFINMGLYLYCVRTAGERELLAPLESMRPRN